MSDRSPLVPDTGWLLAVAFGALVALVGVAAWLIERQTVVISREIQRIQEDHRIREETIEDLRSNTYRLAIQVRDYLLDPSPSSTAEQRGQLLAVRQSMLDNLRRLEEQPGGDGKRAAEEFRREIEQYWGSLNRILSWTPSEKQARGTAFLQTEVIPYRRTILSLVQRMADLNASNLRQRSEALEATQREYRRSVWFILAATVILGVLIGGVSVSRLASLERQTADLLRQTEQDRQALRSLSLKLVKTQEEERRSISRELHDQVGQMLTAIQMEFGNLATLRNAPGEEFQEHLKEGRTLAERTLQAVRDIAMGLRPSMLDDLGLAPALEWQTREFTRRSGIPARLEMGGDLNQLSEGVRTCVYRVVQEALTNCARHAQAKQVKIRVEQSGQRVCLTVQDDGRGFQRRETGRRGLGLIGIEERVKELKGTAVITSDKGTLLCVELPLRNGASA